MRVRHEARLRLQLSKSSMRQRMLPMQSTALPISLQVHAMVKQLCKCRELILACDVHSCQVRRLLMFEALTSRFKKNNNSLVLHCRPPQRLRFLLVFVLGPSRPVGKHLRDFCKLFSPDSNLDAPPNPLTSISSSSVHFLSSSSNLQRGATSR